MKKILFPTDFSKASLNAFRYALELANTFDAEIITLHVYELPIMDHGMEFNVAPYLLETYNIFELGHFENFKGQIPLLRNLADDHNLSHIKISNILLEGDLQANILATIKEEHIDYVVMSTKGSSGLEEVFLGSTTAKIMTSTKAVVLGIPESSRFEPIKRIGFMTHFQEDEIRPLQKVIAIAKSFGARVDCLYVRIDDKVSDVVQANWELNFKDEVTFNIIENQHVEAAILDYVQANQVNMLAMLNHKHGFFESLFHESRTRKMAYHTKVPLLALHED